MINGPSEKRLKKFLDEWRIMPKTGDSIYGLHCGDEREAFLLASDIQAMLDKNASLSAAFAEALCHLSPEGCKAVNKAARSVSNE